MCALILIPSLAHPQLGRQVLPLESRDARQPSGKQRPRTRRPASGVAPTGPRTTLAILLFLLQKFPDPHMRYADMMQAGRFCHGDKSPVMKTDIGKMNDWFINLVILGEWEWGIGFTQVVELFIHLNLLKYLEDTLH